MLVLLRKFREYVYPPWKEVLLVLKLCYCYEESMGKFIKHRTQINVTANAR